MQSSRRIGSAKWTSRRYGPPSNQTGDILPTVAADNGKTYVLINDGGVDPPVAKAIWRQSFAEIDGAPPKLRFRHVGDPNKPPPHTGPEIAADINNDTGPLGPYYSDGFTERAGVFYATQLRNWDWNANAPFSGLVGIAYSMDHGNSWLFPNKSFPPPIGNLTFVDGGSRGGAFHHGYLYAINSEREFDASTLILGRVPSGIGNITDPGHWQWFAGYRRRRKRVGARWTSSLKRAAPILRWTNHITYPQFSYDAPLRRYLLTFTYSYVPTPPGVWQSGAELVIAEAPAPWGPYSFVARSSYFGPSNGYAAAFPPEWMSRDGKSLWLKWAANFSGCRKGLKCTGAYGMNLARVRLSLIHARKPSERKHHKGSR